MLQPRPAVQIKIAVDILRMSESGVRMSSQV